MLDEQTELQCQHGVSAHVAPDLRLSAYRLYYVNHISIRHRNHFSMQNRIY